MIELSAAIERRVATRAAIVAEARTWIGTPWRHQGRLKGIASDCAGLVIGVARGVGLVAPDFDVNGYSAFPDPQIMRAVLERFMDRVVRSRVPSSGFRVPGWESGLETRNSEPETLQFRPPTPQPGDVLFLAPRRLPHHVAIVGAKNLSPVPTIIHAIDKTRGVREQSLPPGYRVAAIYRFRGIID